MKQTTPLLCAATLALGLLSLAPQAQARSFRVAQIPDGSCNSCHISPGGPRNALGLQIEAILDQQALEMGVAVSSLSVDWQQIFQLDADEDGYSNGYELGDVNGAWMPGDASTPTSDPNNQFSPDVDPMTRCSESPNETLCDGVDNDCDGMIDEGVTNACGVCGAVPQEVCDGEDNDCDGMIDEGVLNACGECGEVPQEVCDGMDNDCDGDIDEGLLCGSPAFGGFQADQASIVADGMDTQTLRLTLQDAASVDEVRLMINRAGQSENGREYDGYFRILVDGMNVSCEEVGAGLGNDKLVLDTMGCEANLNMDGSVEFVASFAVDLSYGAADNNQVSALWYAGGTLLTGWRKVTGTGMGFDVELPAPQPLGLRRLTFDEASVYADGADVQTLRLTLEGAANVNEVRLMINRAGQSENGREYDGYFSISTDGMNTSCQEVGTTLGNDKVALQTDGCQINPSLDGSVEFVLPLVFAPGFGLADNNHVSALWYVGGVLQTGWRKVTVNGMGFDVTAPPLGFSSFGYDKATVLADGADLQTFRLRLNGAADVNEVRFLINRSGQSENGRTNSGYIRLRWDGMSVSCEEVGTTLGNDKIAVQAMTGCAATAQPNGGTEFSISFTVDRFFGDASNNQVSALWYANGVLQTGWRKVTGTGMGFGVMVPVVPVGTFDTFSFAMDEVANDNVEPQTLRLRLRNAASVDEVRFLINRAGQSENGREYDGYFSVSTDGMTTTCEEVGTTLGNDKVEVQPDLCDITLNPDGSADFVLGYTLSPEIPASLNHQVSAIWYADGTQLTSWRKVTGTGMGFDVVPGLASLNDFGYDAPSVVADGLELQTLRLRLNAGQSADDVRFLINRAGQSENGRSYDGYFQFQLDPESMTWSCRELGTGLGNSRVEAVPEMCQVTSVGGGVLEFAFPFTVDPSFGAAENNQVSAIWYADGVQLTGWRKVTGSGMGFDVTAAP